MMITTCSTSVNLLQLTEGAGVFPRAAPEPPQPFNRTLASSVAAAALPSFNSSRRVTFCTAIAFLSTLFHTESESKERSIRQDPHSREHLSRPMREQLFVRL